MPELKEHHIRALLAASDYDVYEGELRREPQDPRITITHPPMDSLGASLLFGSKHSSPSAQKGKPDFLAAIVVPPNVSLPNILVRRSIMPDLLGEWVEKLRENYDCSKGSLIATRRENIKNYPDKFFFWIIADETTKNHYVRTIVDGQEIQSLFNRNECLTHTLQVAEKLRQNGIEIPDFSSPQSSPNRPLRLEQDVARPDAKPL